MSNKLLVSLAFKFYQVPVGTVYYLWWSSVTYGTCQSEIDGWIIVTYFLAEWRLFQYNQFMIIRSRDPRL